MHSIIIIIPHFGQWPAWIDFFVESCKSNSNIDWVIPSDCGPLPRNSAANIRILPFSFSEYSSLISETLRIRFAPDAPYKLCDVRPALGEIHSEQINGYDFFGFGDVDVIYGRIRKFYTDEILKKYSVLSTHQERLSGHFALLRNVAPVRAAFRRIPLWKELMEDDRYVGLDENQLLSVFKLMKREAFWCFNSFDYILQERYSSPGPTEEMRWFWKDGTLTNEFYGRRQFLYLHFMHWKSSRWYPKRPNLKPGTPAPWEKLASLVQFDWRRANADGFMISPKGIQEIAYRMFGKSDQP
jgi:hypothetical protein